MGYLKYGVQPGEPIPKDWKEPERTFPLSWPAAPLPWPSAPLEKPPPEPPPKGTPGPKVVSVQAVRHAMAITTYMEPKWPERLEVFKRSLWSLLDSGYPSTVYIIDDASTTNDHLDYAAEVGGSRVEIIRRPENGGVARSKNRGVRAILESGADFGFLADDDVGYKPGWWEAYVEAHLKTGIHHFTFIREVDGELQNIDGFWVKKYHVHQGALITFTRKMIETMGYYKVLPTKLGHEHTQFTNRAVYHGLNPFIADLANSEKFVENIDGGSTTRSSEIHADWARQFAESHQFIHQDMNVKEECKD